MEDGDGEGHVIVYIVAGCAAGAIEATATWPTEYIKTKLQLQRQVIDNSGHIDRRAKLADPSQQTYNVYDDAPASPCDGFALEVIASADELLDDPPVPLLPYTDMLSGVLYTVRTLGFSALYYGLAPTLLGSIPKAGIRFGLFAWFSHLLRDPVSGVTSAEMCFVAGCLAGVAEALLVVVPIETMKTKCIQLDMPFWRGAREVVFMEGIGGLYQGALATAVKQGSNQGLRFLWYGTYKSAVTRGGEVPLTPLLAFLGGMTAGVFSSVVNQPADVVKTRMQGVRAGYTSTGDCVWKTYRAEGVAGFYTGIVPRLSRVIPGQGILFLSYEMIVSVLLLFYA